jgi:hypothetical protein
VIREQGGDGRGRLEVVRMAFIRSDDWVAWGTILANGAIDHKTLYKFLLKQEHNLTDGNLLAAVGSIRVNSTVNYESDLQEFGESVGMLFKTAAGEELKKFPKQLAIVLPVLEEDQDADRWASATVRLNVQMPAGPTDKPMFTMICSKWEQILLARIRAEGKKIVDELGSDWAGRVLHGEYAYISPRSDVECSWKEDKIHDED